MISLERAGWALGMGLCCVLCGCGTPGAPQPPSLNLPDAVRDLSASRAGDQVTLTWVMPKRNTDRTAIKGEVAVRICWREDDGRKIETRDRDVSCDSAGQEHMESPGKPGSMTEAMTATFTTGTSRPVNYFVELRNRKGRSAGLSNAATVLAGAAPAQIEGLKAEVQKEGAVLNWIGSGESGAVRLERKLLTPAAKKQERGILKSAPEPVEQNFIVDTAEQARALDKTVHFGEKYEYRAQRVVRVNVNGETLELDGAFSEPVEVEVKDVFPPAVPTGLVAVAMAGENGGGPAIDLSWQPNTDPDLAGYIVYRREEGGAWKRVPEAAPGIEPAFHDAQVQAGHQYEYAVSAVDKDGHESGRSAEAQETVPLS